MMWRHVPEADNRTVREQFSDMSVMDVAGVLLNPVGSSVRLSAGVCGRRHSRPFLHVRADPVHSRQIHVPAPAGTYIPCGDSCFYNESTRTYFHTWCKNLLVCYLMVPAFILASKFSDAIVCEYVMNTSWNVVLQVLFSLALKLSLLAIVRGRIHNLF